MKVAIPVWRGRISPVFDVAGQLLLLDLTDGQPSTRQEQVLEEEAADGRAARLAELGVETLICAGVSKPLETALAAQGVRVIAHVCGDVEEVLQAFVKGNLQEPRFAMPGCCGQKRRRRYGRCGRGRNLRGKD